MHRSLWLLCWDGQEGGKGGTWKTHRINQDEKGRGLGPWLRREGVTTRASLSALLSPAPEPLPNPPALPRLLFACHPHQAPRPTRLQLRYPMGSCPRSQALTLLLPEGFPEDSSSPESLPDTPPHPSVPSLPPSWTSLPSPVPCFPILMKPRVTALSHDESSRRCIPKGLRAPPTHFLSPGKTLPSQAMLSQPAAPGTLSTSSAERVTIRSSRLPSSDSPRRLPGPRVSWSSSHSLSLPPPFPAVRGSPRL